MAHYTTLREANEARQKEWDADNQITLAYRGNELAGEVGEACNVIKKLERERMGIRGSRDTVEHLAEEQADISICNDLIAMQAGIDLDAAIRTKFNATSEKMGLATRLVAPVTDQTIIALQDIVALTVALRSGGPALEDLHGLSEALEMATNIAHAALAAINPPTPALTSKDG